MRVTTIRAAGRLAASAFVAAATAAVSVSIAAPAQAEGTVLGVDAPGVIPNSYVVVMKDDVGVTAAATAKQYGASIKHTYTAALNGYSATMSAEAAKRTAADPAVAYVEQDRVISAVGTQPNPPSWGLDRIDQRDLALDSSYTYSNTAPGVTAYIIDTGIRTTHSDFGGRASWGTNTVDSNNTDCNGHGTHVAGTVAGTTYGVAKEARLVAVKVLNCQGSGTLAGVAAGIDWVTANAAKPAVANMSLGAQGTNASLETAVRNSISSGVVYAIASGNSSADACNFTPARTPEAITVNSIDRNDARSSFSNFGTCTDVFAPGRDITSAWNTNDTATNTISGTSMATPHVAGVAALYLGGNPSATPAQVQTSIKDFASKGNVTGAGSGSPNNLVFAGQGADPDPEDPGEEPGPEPCDGFEPWSATQFYLIGDTVGHNGHAWLLANWFSFGEAPGTTTSWLDLGPC
jgi:subtilisin family serine protease